MEDNFNLICSDLTKVRLSRTAGASSAVPVVLSPVTFNNYGGHCGFEFPSINYAILPDACSAFPRPIAG
jgi:NTE family protein